MPAASQGIRTSPVTMAPGAVIPAHARGVEQIYVLAGTGHVAGEELSPGDYCRVPAGSAHQTSTHSGWSFLSISASSTALT